MLMHRPHQVHGAVDFTVCAYRTGVGLFQVEKIRLSWLTKSLCEFERYGSDQVGTVPGKIQTIFGPNIL